MPLHCMAPAHPPPAELTGVTLRGLSTASGHARPSDAALRIPAQQMSHVANPRTRHLRSVHVAHWRATSGKEPLLASAQVPAQMWQA